MRIFQSLAGNSDPFRVPDIMTYVRGLGLPEFTTPPGYGADYPTLAVPMFHRNSLLGYVFVGGREDGEEFTKEDKETLLNTSPVGVVVFHALTGAAVSANSHC